METRHKQIDFASLSGKSKNVPKANKTIDSRNSKIEFPFADMASKDDIVDIEPTAEDDLSEEVGGAEGLEPGEVHSSQDSTSEIESENTALKRKILELERRQSEKQRLRDENRKLREKLSQLEKRDSSDDCQVVSNSEGPKPGKSRQPETRDRTRPGTLEQTTSTDSSSDTTPLKKKKGKSRRKLRSGITRKTKSTKVQRELDWAHANVLDREDLEFKDMDFPTYIQGETEILEKVTNSKEVMTRLYVMGKMAKLEPLMGFTKGKLLYKKVLLGLEKKTLNFQDYTRIDQMYNEVILENLRGNKTKYNSRENPKKPELVWCNEFNQGRCPFSTHHDGKFGQQTVKKWHICKTCWDMDGLKKSHKPGTDSCPNKE